MSKPTTVPTWATDTNIATGTETGTPTKVQPSAGFIGQGLVPGDTFVGPYFNWLLNLISLWCTYLNGLATDAQFLANSFVWTGAHTIPTLHLSGSNNPNFTTPVVRTTDLDMHRAVKVAGTLAFSTDGDALFGSSSDVIRIPFRLPSGATLATASARFNRGGSGTITMKLMARGKSGTGSSKVQVGATQTDTGVTSPISLSVSGLSETALDTTWYWMECTTTSATDDVGTATIAGQTQAPRRR